MYLPKKSSRTFPKNYNVFSIAMEIENGINVSRLKGKKRKR